MQLDVLAERSVQHLFDVADDIVDIHDLRLNHLTAGKRKQLMSQVRRTLGGQAHLLYVLAHARPAILRESTRRSDLPLTNAV